MSLEKLKKALKEKKLIIGTKTTLKNLKLGKINTVFMASNCPDNVKEDILYYSKLSGAKVIDLDMSDEEIGMICKKRHSISVLSF